MRFHTASLFFFISLASLQTVSSQANIEDIYLIFPKDAKDAGNSALTTELQQTFGPRLTVDSDAVTGVGFWAAPLDPAQVEKYKANSLVHEDHSIDGPSC